MQPSSVDDLRWLSEQGAHFALPAGRTKNKFEIDWPNKPHSLADALAHAKHGGNVGILTGKHSSNIIAIDRDIDFPKTCEMLGQFAQTVKIVRSNAPERGKFLYRINGNIPPTTAWKAHKEDKHPACEFLADQGQRHALAPPSEIDGGHYVLLDRDCGIQEITPEELDHIWRLITGGSICKDRRTQEQEQTDRINKDDYVYAVKQAWDTLRIFQHFNKGEAEESRGQTRILGNGGLLISADGNQWYNHSESTGGDNIDAWAYCKWGKILDRNDPKMFWDIINDMGDTASIPRPQKSTKSVKHNTWPYAVQNNCIGEWKEYKDKDGEMTERFEERCNFNAWIVADIAADDGEEKTRKIALEGVLKNGMTLEEIEIDAEEFEAMKWPVARWGARVSIEPTKGAANILRHAIQRLSEETMINRHTLTHTGWTVLADGRRVFLHAGGAIGAENVSVDLPRNLSNYRFPKDDAVDPVEAMRESIKLMDIAPPSISTPIYAAMFLGPLNEIIEAVFTLSVEGGSGSLKSSYTAIMLNHYGAKFTEYAMPADWLGTANSLEKLCFHAKDVTLPIDDFRPSTNPAEARALQDAANKITRAAGNRQGRSRLDANSEFKRSYAPRGVVMMTAERKALGKSTNSRILTVDVEPGDIDHVKLGVAQKQRHVYAYAMRWFIKWVAENWEELSKVLPTQVTDIRAANSGSGHHRRLPNATAIVYTAFNCAMSYAVDIGAITEEEAKQRMDACYFALQNIEENQNQATEAEDPAQKYLVIIATLIAQNKAYLLSKSRNEAVVNIGSSSLSEKLGWHDGHNVYLLPGAYNAVCKYATTEGWTFPSDEITLRKELERGGYITKTDENRLTTRQRVPGENGEREHVTAVSYAKFSEILNSMGVDL